MPIRDAFAQTQWFRLLVAALAQAGLRRVIVSPGSRSTPMVCALQQHSAFQVTVCIDERAAAFLALGVARATGETCAVLCTSGTAPAHYYPAVIEAAHSALPLLIISADRPTELQANGAAQTIDHARLFGVHVRAFLELGTPEARASALSGLARKVAQGVALTKSPHPGPVHLNAQAFKPLEPVSSNTPEEAALEQRVGAMIASPLHQFHAGTLAPSGATALALAKRWAQAQRPVLFCGPSPCYAEVSKLGLFAAQSGWPVLAEITHPLRQRVGPYQVAVIDAFDLVSRAQPEHLQPDLVVAVGATPTSSAWLTWLARCTTAALDVIAPNSLTDPLNRASNVVQCQEEPLFEAVGPELLRILPAARASEWQQWGKQWQSANLTAKQQVQQYLASLGSQLLSEAQVLALVSKHIAPNDLVVLGNSLPIRLAETFFDAQVPFQCLSQRGVSGIDGLIAGAVGASLGTSRRSWLFLGDVSAVHDLASLRLLDSLAANVVIVVIDNDGGRIFDSLPIAQQVSDLSAWTTPHGTPFGPVAQAMGLSVTQVATGTALTEALTQLPSSGALVLWAQVAPHGSERVYQDLVPSISLRVQV